ncbi:hypothetical protein ACPOL_4297 [Acidisarcina polymorpha]|uniref:HicB-like antitoxin of toxin-antitoxin system domain-containing protein n=1 Tax=Acidisarcina polymorpha TaxID=2211140 RepID=A0A2Z5G376_9BACT|nr:type II toxin-antitoxin system HicB family antitoxin [Acidisarcina polymorpha]AXC13572.1 hypothetical protein ACPOL_4297 [Acidisarcina polymorpha]
MHRSEEGYCVSWPSLPGCHSQGETKGEALENIKLTIQEYLEAKAKLEVSPGEQIRL